MGGDEVVRQELVPPHPAAAGIEHPLESLQDIRSRLPHEVEDPVADMLRCYLHLPRHMLGDERFQIGGTVPPVGEDHVVAYPGIHEDMPDPVDIGDGLEQGGLTGMIDRKSGAGLPDEASAVLAAAVGGLLGAFDAVHVGRRTSDILDHAVEALGRGQSPRLPEYGFLGTGDDRRTLMDGYGAERAVPVASPVGGYRIADRVHRLHLPVLGVVRVDGVLEIRSVGGIQLLRGHAPSRAVLDQPSVPVPLAERRSRDGIGIVPEDGIRLHECTAVVPVRDLLVGRELDAILGLLRRCHAYPVDPLPVLPVPHQSGDLQVGELAHAVDHRIGLGIEEDRSPHRIRPVVVMGDPPEARLYPCEKDGPPLAVLLDQVGVGYACAVGTAVVPLSGGEIVLLAELLSRSVIGDHGIHTARRYGPEQPGLPET